MAMPRGWGWDDGCLTYLQWLDMMIIRRIIGENRAYSREKVPLLPLETSTVSVEWVEKRRCRVGERHRLCTYGTRVRIMRRVSMTRINERECYYPGEYMGRNIHGRGDRSRERDRK